MFELFLVYDLMYNAHRQELHSTKLDMQHLRSICCAFTDCISRSYLGWTYQSLALRLVTAFKFALYLTCQQSSRVIAKRRWKLKYDVNTVSNHRHVDTPNIQKQRRLEMCVRVHTRNIFCRTLFLHQSYHKEYYSSFGQRKLLLVACKCLIDNQKQHYHDGQTSHVRHA